jgi:dTDP-glucose 4,6-dehydratase
MFAKVAVIGASSFSGVAFCRYARSLGVEVLEMSRREHDVNEVPWNIARRIAAFGDCAVVNFAALNMVAESWAHYQDYYRTNVIGIANVLSCLGDAGWEGRWVQVSTPEVYGPCDHVIREGQHFNPSTPYAVSRAACDMHLSAMHQTYGFDCVFTRTVNVYGPAQQPYRIIPKTVLSILRGVKLPLHGGGTSLRAFIHVDDMAAAIWKAMTNGRSGEDYHASAGELISIAHLVDKICDIMKVDPATVTEMTPERPGKDPVYFLDDSSLRIETGWEPKIDLDGGLRDTVLWFMLNAERYADVPLTYEHKP